MKKYLSIAIILISILLFNYSAVFASENDFYRAENVFLTFMASEISENDFENLKYKNNFLYDLNLNHSGYEIEFTFGTEFGYALLAKMEFDGEVFYELEEVALNEFSPYCNVTGKKIYFSPFIYLSYENGKFENAKTKEKISNEQLIALSKKDFKYSGADGYTTNIDSVSYHHKTENSNKINGDLPKFFAMYGTTRCAVVAGANLIAFYDRLYENLIPNYQTYRLIAGNILYKTEGSEIQQLQAELYRLTETDVGGAGTTFTGFVKGLSAYINNQGYRFSYDSLMNWGKFDFEAYKAAIDREEPVTIFLSNFSIVPTDGFTSSASSENILQYNYSSNHVVVGCGYKIVNYYDANDHLQAERKYLRVSSGLDAYKICYLNISTFTQITNAILIHIN